MLSVLDSGCGPSNFVVSDLPQASRHVDSRHGSAEIRHRARCACAARGGGEIVLGRMAATASKPGHAPNIPDRGAAHRHRGRAAGRRARPGRAAAGVPLRQSPRGPADLCDRARHDGRWAHGRGRRRRADVSRSEPLRQGPWRMRHRAARLRPRHANRAGRGALRLAETEIRRSAPAGYGVCRLLPAGRGRIAERPACDDPLEVRPRARDTVPGRPRRARAALGQGRDGVSSFERGFASSDAMDRGFHRSSSPGQPGNSEPSGER